MSPAASSSAAMTPTDFCASLAPWLNASAAEVTHCDRLDWCCPPSGRPAAEDADGPDCGQRGQRAQRRRDGKRDQRSQHADGMEPVQATPVDCVGAPRQERGPDETPDEGVAGARGEPERPRDPVPGRCRREAGSDDRYRLRWRHRDDAPDRVRNGSPDEQRTEQVAHRSEHDGRTRSRRARRDQGRDRVGGVVQPVGDGKGQREAHRDDEPRVHAGRLSGPPRGARSPANCLSCMIQCAGSQVR